MEQQLAPGTPVSQNRQRITKRCKCGNEFETPRGFSDSCPECVEKAKEKKETERIELLKETREENIFNQDWTPPERFFLEITLASFKSALQPKAFRAAKEFLAPSATGLLLWGPVGVGKTHLAAAIFNHYWEQWDRVKNVHPDARFLREYDIFARLRASFRLDSEETEAEILEDFVSRAGVLIIDDVCKYQPADPTFRNRIYYELFDRLWSVGDVRVVLTANISPEALAEELGAPTADRIRDMCRVVEMTGPSQRGKGKQ